MSWVMQKLGWHFQNYSVAQPVTIQWISLTSELWDWVLSLWLLCNLSTAVWYFCNWIYPSVNTTVSNINGCKMFWNNKEKSASWEALLSALSFIWQVIQSKPYLISRCVSFVFSKTEETFNSANMCLEIHHWWDYTMVFYFVFSDISH